LARKKFVSFATNKSIIALCSDFDADCISAIRILQGGGIHKYHKLPDDSKLIFLIRLARK
jgi:hypothetical protein